MPYESCGMSRMANFVTPKRLINDQNDIEELLEENKKLVDEKENLLKLLDHEKRLKEGVLNAVEKHAEIQNELNHLKKENHDLAQENDHLNNQNDFNKGLVLKIQASNHLWGYSIIKQKFSEGDWSRAKICIQILK